MLYCPECGTANPEQGRFCTECGTELPQPISSQASQSVTSRSSTSVPQSQSQGESWWEDLSPDWKGGIIFGAGWSIASIINIGTVSVGFVFTFPILIALSLIQGIVVARYASRDRRYTQANYLKLGLLSGFWVVLISLATTVLTALVMTGVTLFTILAALPGWILLTFTSILIQLGLPALGSWLYSKYGGKKLIGILVGVGCGVTVIIGILIAILIAILGSLGISLLQ